MNLIYLKIILKYIKKMFSVYLLMMVTIITTLVLVFTPIVVVKSQSLNIRNYLNTYKTSYDAIAKDINKAELEKIGENKSVKSKFYQKNLGTFKQSNDDTKYAIKTFNNDIFKLERYELIKGHFPELTNEIIVSENSYLKKYIGKDVSGVITNDFEKNYIHSKINNKENFKVVGIYKRETKTQEIINKLQIDYSEDILTNKEVNIHGETKYNLYLIFNRGGKSVSSIIYNISENVFGDYYSIESNQLSDKINDSFINATNDAIRMFKPIIICGSLIMFLIYLLVFEDRRKMLSIIQTIGGQKKKIIGSMIFENIIITITTIILGVLIGVFISDKMVKGTDLTGFVADLDIENKKLYVSYKDIINSSLVALISLIIITVYECLDIYGIDRFKFSGKIFKKKTRGLKKTKSCKLNYTIKLSYDYFKASIKRYIIPVIVMSMFGSLVIGFYNIEKNDNQFANKTRFDQINKFYDSSLSNNTYLGDASSLLNKSFTKNLSSIKVEYNSLGYIVLNTNELNKDFKEMLGVEKNNIPNYEMTTYIRGINNKEMEKFTREGVLNKQDLKILKDGGAILINGFYYRNMAMNMQIFNKEPKNINLKHVEYNNDEEHYINKKISNISVHGYDEKYKSINPEIEEPMIIMGENELKSMINIKQPTNIYFNFKNDQSEKNINKILENNQKYIIFNSKQYKEKNKSISSVLYVAVKKINIIVLLLFSIITMMFTIKLTIIYREDDIVTLRAIGASNKKILHIFIYEGLILGVFCSSISLIFGLKKGYINYTRYASEQIDKAGIHFLLDFRSMLVCIIIIILLSVLFQVVYLKKRDIRKGN